jgi:hypothetical protein
MFFVFCLCATILFGGYLTVSLPRKYPPQFQPEDWNAMVDRVNGITLNGVRAYPYNYLIRNVGGVYDAIDESANLAFGGSSDANGVDGHEYSEVIQAALDVLASSSGIVLHRDGAYIANTEVTVPDKVAIEGGSPYGTIIKAGAAINSIFNFRAVPQVEIENMTLDADNKAKYCIDAGQDTNYARETWFANLDAKNALDTNINCYNREVCTMNFVHTYGAPTGIDARSGSGTLDWTNVNVINSSLRGAYLGGAKICWNMGGGGGTNRNHIQLGGSVGSLSFHNVWFEGGGTFIELNDDGIDGVTAPTTDRYLDQLAFKDAAVYIADTNYFIKSYAIVVPSRIVLDTCSIARISGVIKFCNYRPYHMIASSVSTVGLNMANYPLDNHVVAFDGFVTESRGDSSVTISSSAGNVSFAHGLYKVPSDVNVTFTGALGVDRWSWSADDTDITVYVVGNPDAAYPFHWTAKMA